MTGSGTFPVVPCVVQLVMLWYSAKAINLAIKSFALLLLEKEHTEIVLLAQCLTMKICGGGDQNGLGGRPGLLHEHEHNGQDFEPEKF